MFFAVSYPNSISRAEQLPEIYLSDRHLGRTGSAGRPSTHYHWRLWRLGKWEVKLQGVGGE